MTALAFFASLVLHAVALSAGSLWLRATLPEQVAALVPWRRVVVLAALACALVGLLADLLARALLS